MIREGRSFAGVDAVIDKDLASARLAAEVGVDRFLIATDEPGAALDYGTPDQRFLPEMTVEEAEGQLEAGQFPAGSMGPKIEAAVAFVKSGGREAIIASVDRIGEAVDGQTGTRIVRGG